MGFSSKERLSMGISFSSLMIGEGSEGGQSSVDLSALPVV